VRREVLFCAQNEPALWRLQARYRHAVLIYTADQVVISNTPRLEIIIGISGLASCFVQLLNALLIKRYHLSGVKGKAYI
jgi:hypothetical protein